MSKLAPELRRWLAAARHRLDAFAPQPEVTRFGRILRIGDEVMTVAGLEHVRLDEMGEAEGGGRALAVRIREGSCGCVVVEDGPGLQAGGRVRPLGDVVRVPVGEALLGRLVDALGRPLDGGPPIRAEAHWPVERPAPAIVDRDFVRQPLLTGIAVIDAMLPIGRGQRELLLGDRKTGKTAIAVDAVINQKRSDVICVYAAIGQKMTSVRQIVDAVRAHGPFERCIFVVGAAESPAGHQWLVPFAACSMAEYFRDRGQHALLVIDDLTKHADIHRQIALLLRAPPGREAYPGDVFALHARLLERSAKLAPDLGGGSLTALPIAETQAGNLSAYIPTNLISITDGQIYLEPRLFHEGQKPAVNVGLSVSRVGGKAQPPALRRLAEHLRLDYAQFQELELFTRFGGVTDERTRRTLRHGRRIRFLLGQPQYAPLSLGQLVLLLVALEERRLDAVPEKALGEARRRLLEAAPGLCAAALARIEQMAALEPPLREALLAAVDQVLSGLAGGEGG